MPAARAVFKRCKCEECLERDVDGVLMDTRLMPVHVNRVQEECSRHKGFASDDLAGHLFGLTLTDDGPNQRAGADKLWKLCADYQENGPSNDLIAGSLTTLPLSDITHSLGRLQLYDPHPAQPSISGNVGEYSTAKLSSRQPANVPKPCSAHSSTLADIADCPTMESSSRSNVPQSQSNRSHLPPDPHSLHSSSPGGVRKYPAAESPSLPAAVAGCRIPTKDRHTDKALEILSNIEARTQRCFRLLLDGSNEQALPVVRKELGVLRRAAEDVRRNTDVVKSRKDEIIATLERLEVELRLHEPPEDSLKDPVFFETGEFCLC